MTDTQDEKVEIVGATSEPDPFTAMVWNLTKAVTPIVQNAMADTGIPPASSEVCTVCKKAIGLKGHGELFVYNGLSYDKYVLCEDCVKRVTLKKAMDDTLMELKSNEDCQRPEGSE